MKVQPRLSMKPGNVVNISRPKGIRMHVPTRYSSHTTQTRTNVSQAEQILDQAPCLTSTKSAGKFPAFSIITSTSRPKLTSSWWDGRTGTRSMTPGNLGKTSIKKLSLNTLQNADSQVLVQSKDVEANQLLFVAPSLKRI